MKKLSITVTGLYSDSRMIGTVEWDKKLYNSFANIIQPCWNSFYIAMVSLFMNYCNYIAIWEMQSVCYSCHGSEVKIDKL